MLLEVQELTKYFSSDFFGKKKQAAVDHVNFSLKEGECLGLIGESGCGKSTIGKMIAGLLKPDEGSILFEGQRTDCCKERELRGLRRDLQIVFQYPQQAFNPKEKLIHAVREPIRNFGLAADAQEEERIIDEMISSVGITADQLNRYPHEISGGQAQRIAIARSLVLNPKLLIADEVTSMLDVSVQAQILNILMSEQKKRHLGMIFISHDLEVIRAVCDRIIVMKEGKIVEEGAVEAVFHKPQESFTRYLLNSYIEI